MKDLPRVPLLYPVDKVIFQGGIFRSTVGLRISCTCDNVPTVRVPQWQALLSSLALDLDASGCRTATESQAHSSVSRELKELDDAFSSREDVGFWFTNLLARSMGLEFGGIMEAYLLRHPCDRRYLNLTYHTDGYDGWPWRNCFLMIPANPSRGSISTKWTYLSMKILSFT